MDEDSPQVLLTDQFSPLQIVLTLKNNNPGQSELYYSFYKTEDPETEELDKINIAGSLEIDNKILLEFYKPTQRAGYSLKLDENSQFIASYKESENNQINIIDFWLLFEGNSHEFFSVVHKLSLDTIIILNNSNLNILTNTYGMNSEIVYEYFLSPKTWNHFLISFSNITNEIEVYLNGEIAIRSEFLGEFKLDEYDFVFQNQYSFPSFRLDQLKIWSSDSEIIETLISKKHYCNVSVDNASKLIELNFDDKNFSSLEEDKLNIFSQYIETSESTAPIFSRAPILSVEQFSGYYNVSWKTKDQNSAEKFILEKSVKNSDYVFVHKVDAMDEHESQYFYTDYRNAEEELVCYRVKQVNSDSTIIYSLPVKIGIKELKEFEIIQNFPNPFNPTTNISLKILMDGDYKIKVYNVTGKIVSEIFDGFLGRGTYEYVFDGGNLPSGIYLFEIKSVNVSNAIKMILTK